MVHLKNKILAALVLCLCTSLMGYAQDKNLKLIFIRHAEKPIKGSNLSWQGLNRSLQLPEVLYKKFGTPNDLIVPALGLGDTTKHSRMFQTITPLAIKYNLVVSTVFNSTDYALLAKNLQNRKGTVIITWEHKGIPQIVKALGVAENLTWPDEDYDSIWIISFENGHARLVKDKEDLNPSKSGVNLP
jgi:hypothetical protein